MKNFVITIGRQFGSGGRELGQLLAAKLGIAYYDKQLLCKAAEQAGVSTDFVERSDERFPSFLGGFFSFNHGYSAIACYQGVSSAISDENIYKAQSDAIKTIAERESCVIVGRSADYVLRDHPRCINIFVHAPIEARIERIMKRGDCSSAHEARSRAEKTNKLRAHYYNFYTPKTWGDAASYDLSIDSSLMPMNDIVEVIAEYVKRRFS
ncbi:MAG: cytidylate kinase-like family protein [Muribaculaceae bacterium]|nr:cytidylate kinase-like family protein [Muribaculaceae bacterium]